MSNGFDYARYQRYLTAATCDLQLRECRSLQEAKGGWGMRHLSPPQFGELADAAVRDPGLRQRWEERLLQGYHVEKFRLRDEIEESFARIPTNEHTSSGYEDAA